MRDSTTSNPDIRFTGSVPEHYDRYLVPLLFADYATDLANRLASPTSATPTTTTTILELAAGTGIVTERLRTRLPATATLTATDLNEPMLAVARDRLRRAGLAANVELRPVDATTLPFD